MSEEEVQEEKQMFPFDALMATGMLWLINKTVFHPRGYALAFMAEEDGTVSGWRIEGNGTEAWQFEPAVDEHYFQLAEQTLAAFREMNAPDA